MRASCLLLSTLLLTACGDDESARPDAATLDAAAIDADDSPDANPLMPGTLEESGLYSDFDDEVIATGVYEYSPEHALWSDGATKRRWIYLPPGTTIDTTDMDYWVFPEGTKLWKQFTRDGVRVETRLLQKVGPEADDWFYAAFAWNAAQTEALATPLGADDVLGTGHDIPSRSDCRKCHDRLSSRVLGFQAIALDHPAVTGEINLADVMTMDWLTAEPTTGTGAGDSFPIPVRAGSEALDEAALGYLHMNCGNCHNPTSDVQNQAAVDWRLRVGAMATVLATPAVTTSSGVPHQITLSGATAIIEPGTPATSAAHMRFVSESSAIQMPPIGREIPDPTFSQTLSDWITSLPQ